MARVRAGATVEDAVCAVLRDVTDEMDDRGVSAPLRFSAALSDGEQLWAIRWASDHKPPSLYLKPQPGGWAIASEPLGDDAQAWTPITGGQLVHVRGTALDQRDVC
jgi:glutamine amidotransferase